MKKIFAIVPLLLCLLLAGCGVYSHSSGKDEVSYVMFTSPKSKAVDVYIDGQKYGIKTVGKKAYRANRNVKKSAKGRIPVAVGKHEVKVFNQQGEEIYSNTIFISIDETKNIEL